MKRLISVILPILLMLSFEAAGFADNANQNETWAVYMYICGSDLEGNGGDATDNIGELGAYLLPDNVTFVLETGGTVKWHNDLMDPDYIERWVFKAEGEDNYITLLNQQPLSSMGFEKTFEDFLKYARKNYPADHTMLIVWDHGGGTVNGACNDENFPNSSPLSVSDMKKACEAVFGVNPENPPIDIMGFDCCLMGTVDVAYAFSGCAKYLIASEEVIPAGGWNYEALAETFSKNPGISALDLGKSLCEGYFDKYDKTSRAGTVTISMSDLSKIGPVVEAYDEFGKDLMKSVYSKPDNFINMAIYAAETENFGGNSRAQGYCNYADLYDFASSFPDIESSKKVCQTIKDCVVCNLTGDFRSKSMGLSCYYPYNGDSEEISTLNIEGASESFKSFYAVLNGMELQENNKHYMKSQGINPDEIPNIKTFYNVDISSTAVQKNSEGRYYVDFGPEVGEAAIDAMVNLYAFFDGDVYYVGTDDEIDVDYNEGIFINNFGGKWLAIGDWCGCVGLDYDSDEYNIYSVAMGYGNDICFLQMGYNFEDGSWEDLGARWSTEEPGQARAFFPDEGDSMYVLQKYWNEQDGAFRYVAVGEIEYSMSMFDYRTLPDGEYGMTFVLEDAFRNTLSSDMFYFTVVNGEVIYD